MRAWADLSSAERLDAVLRAYAETTELGTGGYVRYGGTPAAAAQWLGLTGPRRQRGPWSGFQNPAQRIIAATRSLSDRGLLRLAPRRGGRSGTAYAPTEAGRARLRELS